MVPGLRCAFNLKTNGRRYGMANEGLCLQVRLMWLTKPHWHSDQSTPALPYSLVLS